MPKVQKTASDSSRNRRIDARSCLGCHRRKVRCDRGVPCTNCARAGCTCIYPSKSSDERKSHSIQHIADRLERVESILSHLCETRGPGGAASSDAEDQGRHDASQPSSAQRSHMSWELLLNDGQMVQYVNNSNIRDLLQDEERMKVTRPSDPEREPAQLQPADTNMLSAQPEPPAATSSGLLEFYPEPQLALRLWSVYVKSVDPVLKILHIPTTQTAVIATILDPKSAGRSMMALTFAVYFAAITALGYHGEAELSAAERSALLKRYKTALDRLLTSTDGMNRPEMTALQALAIYVTCLRAHETGRSVWVLNGLAIRLAQSIGLHRDGANLQLSPFDTEMRLRLWWQLCVLDSRSPEDQGFELTLALDPTTRGLRLPLNIDDHQIFPTMTHLPPETTGWTEMSFFLIQTESCRLLHPVLGTREPFSATALPDLIAKRKMIHDREVYVVRKYGLSSSQRAAGSNNNTLPRIAMQHFTTARRKMEFMLQLREEICTQNSRRDETQTQTHTTNTPYTDSFRPSFRLACESMESNALLLKPSFSLGFRWLFTTYTPWYALAYVLRCLCSCPRGEEAERAWGIVDVVFPLEMSLDGVGGRDLSSEGQMQGQSQGQGQGSIWKCLALLRAQALSLRRARARSEGRSSSSSISTGGDDVDDETQHHLHPQPHLPETLHPSYNGPAPSILPQTETATIAPETVTPSYSSSHPPPCPPEDEEFRPFHTDQTFLAEGTANPSIFSGVDFSMSEIPFLPGWNAVMNGCLGGEGDMDLW